MEREDYQIVIEGGENMNNNKGIVIYCCETVVQLYEIVFEQVNEQLTRIYLQTVHKREESNREDINYFYSQLRDLK